MNTELSNTLAQDINEAAAQCVTLGERSQEMLIEFANAVIVCGTKIITAKENVGRTFLKWLEANVTVSQASAYRYMNAAKTANFSPVKTFAEARLGKIRERKSAP